MPRKQVHLYSQQKMDSLRGVTLPPKIKCGRCSRWLGSTQYSETQLTTVRDAIKTKGHHAQYSIHCQQCRGNKQVVEIECCMCRKTKGLEAFAKVQRKKPDSAKCFACIEVQLEQDAVDEDIYESEDRSKLFDPSDSATGYHIDSAFADTTATEPSEYGGWEDNDKYEEDGGGISLSTDFQRQMSMSSVNQENLIETEFDRGSQAGSKGGLSSARTSSWHTKSATTPSTSSGFNPNKYGRPPPKSASGSERTFSSGMVERSDSNVTYKNGWAQIKAYNPKKDGLPPPKAIGQPVSKSEDNEWSSSESECDSDSDDETVI